MSNLKLANHIVFQKEVLALILRDKNFCNKFLAMVKRDEDLKAIDFKIFSDKSINAIISIIDKLCEKSETFSIGSLLNEIYRSDVLSVEEKKKCETLIEHCTKEGISLDVKKIETEILLQVKAVKTIKFWQDTAPVITSGDSEKILSIYDKMVQKVEQLRKLALSTRSEVSLESPIGIIEEYASDVFSNIPFGIPELDTLLNGGGKFGGIGRGEVTVIISGVNDGKSLTTISFEANAISLGFKGIHINLEGKRLQPAMRLISNITKISYKNLTSLREFKSENPDKAAKDYFGPEQLKKIEDAKQTIKNLRLFHEIQNCEIESIVTLIREAYIEAPFDFCVIDYASLLHSVSVFGTKADMFGYIFRRLEVLAAELNIAIVTPMQVNRSGLLELRHDAKGGVKYPTYTMDMVADSKKAMDGAATVIAYSRTQEERSLKRGRYSILKQREGVTNYQVGICSEWDTMSMFDGERYYTGYGEEDSKESKTSLELKTLTTKIINNSNSVLSSVSEKTIGEINNIKHYFSKIKSFEIDIKKAKESGIKPDAFDGKLSDYIKDLEDTIELLKETLDKYVSDLSEESKSEIRSVIMDIGLLERLKNGSSSDKDLRESIVLCVNSGICEMLGVAGRAA